MRCAAWMMVATLGLAASAACTLLTSLDGLSGGDARAEDASGPDAVGTVDGGDARVEDAPALDAVDAGDGGVCDEDGLVAHWRFDEGSGLAVRDCTKYGHDGLLTAGTWIPGVHGGALELDGGWVSFGNPAEFQIVGELTVAAFVRIDEVQDSGSAYIVGKSLDGKTSGWRIAGEADRNLSFGMGVGGFFAVSTPSPAPTLVWLHFAAVHRADGTVAIYLNGDPSAVHDAGALVNSTSEMRVGARGDGTSPLIGAVDDVRIYTRALSDAEIHAIALR